MSRKKRRIPLSKALIAIFLSTLLISGSATLAFLYFQKQQELKSRNQAYEIKILAQTGPKKDQLPTDYLIEWLGLSADQRTNLYRFDTDKAEAHLLAHPLIEKAHVRKVHPDTVYVDYRIRQPIGRLLDLSNSGIDFEGNIFPLEPFIDASDLPGVWLLWEGSQFDKKGFNLALRVLELLDEENILEVDVSQSEAPSYGQRQVVVKLQEGPTTLLLRLNPSQLSQALGNFMVLRRSWPDWEGVEVRVVDLRVQNLAFVEEV